jgi:hypothetical protein
MNFYLKKNTDFRAFAKDILNCTSGLFCARKHGYSSDSVRIRVDRLARNSLILLSEAFSRYKIDEDLVADGLESFSVNKYFPNNINILMGSKTQIIYAFNLCHFRRKGQMTELQKKKIKTEYQHKSFKYNDLQNSMKRISDKATILAQNSVRSFLTLHTDENPAYPIALKKNQSELETEMQNKVNHKTISSKEPRSKRNALFSVNYMDREIRKNIPDHRRKTVCFSRNDRNMMSRFAWHAASHNFFKPRNICSAALQTDARHASVLLDCDSQVNYMKENFFDKRFLLSFSHLGQDETSIWTKSIHTPHKKTSDKVPLHIYH